jgi:hypothetical protein
MYNYTITHAIFEPTTPTTMYNYTMTHAIFADVVELMVGRASNRSPVEELNSYQPVLFRLTDGLKLIPAR